MSESPRSYAIYDFLGTIISDELKNSLPPDVRAVMEDFERDYLEALEHHKECLVAALEWGGRASDIIGTLKTYLSAEQMREGMKLRPVAGILGGKPDAD